MMKVLKDRGIKMKIDSKDRDVQDILSSSFYKVPRFQRPYRWDKDNVLDFWQDAIMDSKGDYFIGAMVTYKHKEYFYGVVDGQQRLTTITMVLCALRNAFKKNGFSDLADGLHSLIERKDINNKPQFVLQTETSYPYLQEYIQKYEEPEISENLLEEEKNLKEAFNTISQLIDDITISVSKDPTLKEDTQKSRIKEKLIDVRDKILNLKVIFVSLDNDDDAYLIFETLNTRGKDLTVSDLVKSRLTKLAKQKNVNVDLPRDKWMKMVRVIEESSEDLQLDGFIYHFWLSKYEYLSAKKLYKAIKGKVTTNALANEFLDALVSDSVTYREINEPTYGQWDRQENEIKSSLRALKIFRVKQQLPMLLSVMREYRLNNLKKKHVELILQAIENFHFVFTAITSQRSSGGISTMYASHAKKLFEAKTSEEKISVLHELKKQLQSKKPGYQEFEARFLEIKYSDIYTKQKPLVQYILQKIDEADPKGVSVNYEQMTIEHLAPQKTNDTKKISNENCAQIGNLIYVNHDLNNMLSNKPFGEKIKILKDSRIKLDDSLNNATTWSEEEIEQRTRLLAKLAYEKIWN